MSIRNLVLLGGVSLLAGLGLGWSRPEPTELRFLAVGQGDCAVFRHGGTTILIDAGPAGFRHDAGKRIIVPRLRELGVQSVDLILVSHPDADHTGGLGAVLRVYPRARLVVSEAFRQHPDLLQDLKEWGLKPESVLWIGSRRSFQVGDFRFDLANPRLLPGAPDNDASMFTRISSGNAVAVLTGDAPSSAESTMAAGGDWRADVLKAGHHGSGTSTSSAWLEEVRPTYTVVSCGRDNRYGHPNPEVVERLKAAGSRVWRTDRQGEIAFQIRDGHFYPVAE